MKTTLTTNNNNGVLKIIGNPQETILYLKDKPIQYSWYAEIGTTQRYHIAQGLKKQAVYVNTQIENLLQKGIKTESVFLMVAAHFNSFLKPGTYHYGMYEMGKGLHWINIPKAPNYESFDYYGNTVGITPTQNRIDKNKVAEYEAAILKGARPVMVFIHVENSWMFFILDGHHKFQAYINAKVKPQAIIITKHGNDYFPIAETLALAQKMNCTNKEYLTWMEKEKKKLKKYKKQILDLDERFDSI